MIQNHKYIKAYMQNQKQDTPPENRFINKTNSIKSD